MRARFVGTLQFSVAVGPGALRFRVVPLKGDVAGWQLWLGPLGLGLHLIAKNPNLDTPRGRAEGDQPPSPGGGLAPTPSGAPDPFRPDTRGPAPAPASDPPGGAR